MWWLSNIVDKQDYYRSFLQALFEKRVINSVFDADLPLREGI
jgi:hypothetical protein